jgi:hypothetical protein
VTLSPAERIATWACEGQLDALAALEALADPRIAADPEDSTAPHALAAEQLLVAAVALVPGATQAAVEADLVAAGAERAGDLLRLDAAAATAARSALLTAAAARTVSWSPQPLGEGELLARFTAYCLDELDDVEVLATSPGTATFAWRDERTQAELRWGSLLAERLPGGPWLLLAPIDKGAIARFLEDGDLRSRVSLWDCSDCTKVAAARTSLGVHFEWFMRDVYRVKVLPAQAFTEGLLVRGIISLGM